MAVTFVRLPAPAVNSTSATPALTVGASGAAVGDVVIVTAVNPSGSAATGVADNATSTTNVWTFFKSASVAGLTVEVWGCKLTTALASGNTITVTYGASHAVTLAALEFTGQSGALTVDVSNSLATAATDVAPLDAVTTTVAGDFVVEVTANAVVATVDVTVPPGYTAGTSQVAAAPAAYTNYVIPAGTATETPGARQWTSTAGSVGSVQVAFLAAPAVALAKAASPQLVFPVRLDPFRLRRQMPFMSPGRQAYPVVAASTADQLATTATGVGNVTGALSVKHNLATTSTGVGNTTAALSVKHNLATGAAGVGVVTAALSVKHNLATSATGVGSTTAALSVKHNLASSPVGVGRTTAALSVKHNLATGATGVASVTAALTVVSAGKNLAATSTGVGAATAALSVTHRLQASATGVGAATAALSVTHRLATTGTGVGRSTAALGVTHRLGAASTGVGRATAALTVTAAGVQLATGPVGVGRATAALSVQKLLAATAVGVGNASAALSGGAVLTADGTGTGWYRRQQRQPQPQRVVVELAAVATGVGRTTANLTVWSPTYSAEEINALAALVDEEELAVLMSV